MSEFIISTEDNQIVMNILAFTFIICESTSFQIITASVSLDSLNASHINVTLVISTGFKIINVFVSYDQLWFIDAFDIFVI